MMPHMEWVLNNSFDTGDGEIRWNRWGTDGDPIVLVHGTPYSSFLWRDIAPALAQSHRVYVFDLLGYGQSDKQEGQDLTLAAQARHFAHLLASWQIPPPRLVASDIGGAISLRASPGGCVLRRHDAVRLLPVPYGEWLRDRIPHQQMD